jgi:GNAT superfamily N-acetyltransferase
VTDEEGTRPPPLQGVVIRPSVPQDGPYLEEWLTDPETARDFPMSEAAEVKESAVRWIDFYKENAALTAVYQEAPVGVSILFLQHYDRIRHQALHILLTARPYRQMGIGSLLLEGTIKLAKGHGIELLHVEVYGDSAVVLFYKKRGFTVYAHQHRWLKEDGSYRDRICLERFI